MKEAVENPVAIGGLDNPVAMGTKSACGGFASADYVTQGKQLNLSQMSCLLTVLRYVPTN